MGAYKFHCRLDRCNHFTALHLESSVLPSYQCPGVFTPALMTANENRRVLARTAQAAVAQGLHQVSVRRYKFVPQAPALAPITLSSQSAYSLLINPSFQQPYK